MISPSSYTSPDGSASGGTSTTASECAPQPYSTLTTRPSVPATSLPHTPNPARRDPANGSRNPQVPQGAGALRAIAVSGPPSPSYQRAAASSRPSRESTRSRPSPSSNATSSTSGSSEAT